ncbi:MAG: 4-phosphoerythronate dehydrogenase, partial [Planctomycetota bacterium]
MLTTADRNIPFAAEAFGTFGRIRLLPGREMTRENLRDTDNLLVRSVTRVDEKLLAGTPVRFVGTATIGFDHVDTAYLARAGIAFASAQGSNANSVAEYVTTALLFAAGRHKLTLRDKTLGIVGVGNVGSRVDHYARLLGLRVLWNDPPLARKTNDPRYLPLDKVLREADILTCHVPLTKEGPDATYHLMNAERLGALKPGALFLNTSRGPVTDGNALKELLRKKHLAGAILDVWENEPAIDTELLRLADIGTPHIAGYSFDGKANGTRMLHEALAKFRGEAPGWDPTPCLPPPATELLDVKIIEGCEETLLYGILRQAYSPRTDHRNLLRLLRLPPEEHGPWFD